MITSLSPQKIKEKRKEKKTPSKDLHNASSCAHSSAIRFLQCIDLYCKSCMVLPQQAFSTLCHNVGNL